MSELLRVFIETPAGSRKKFIYDDVTLALLDEIDVPLPYPYPYGFLPEHMGADGECVDCYLLTNYPNPQGTEVRGRVVGMIEQWEAGAEDHKILIVPEDAPAELDDAVVETIMAFMRGLFAEFPDMLVTVGPAGSSRAAQQYLTAFGAPAGD